MCCVRGRRPGTNPSHDVVGAIIQIGKQAKQGLLPDLPLLSFPFLFFPSSRTPAGPVDMDISRSHSPALL